MYIFCLICGTIGWYLAGKYRYKLARLVAYLHETFPCYVILGDSKHKITLYGSKEATEDILKLALPERLTIEVSGQNSETGIDEFIGTCTLRGERKDIEMLSYLLKVNVKFDQLTKVRLN